MEERDEEMNAMFHLVLSGLEGLSRAVRGVEGSGASCGKAAVTQDLHRPAPSTEARRRSTAAKQASNCLLC